MPVVPSYDNTTVAPTNLPDTRQQVPTRMMQQADIGPGEQIRLGQAIQHAGAEGMQEIDRQNVINSETDAKAADTDATTKFGDIQYNPQAGYMGLLGKNAVDAYPDTVEVINHVARETLANIKNPAARQLATPIINARAASAIEAAARHATQQNIVYQRETSDSRAVASLQDGANNFNDETKFARGLGAAHSEAVAQGELHGWDEATTQLQAQKYTDLGYKLRYDAWREHDPAAAFANFMQNGNNISPAVRVAVGHQLFEAAAPALAQQLNAAGGSGVVTPDNPNDNSQQPRGVRNNNPGNIMRTDTQWQGEVHGNDPKYSSFETPEAGIRAMGKNLIAYQDNHGINTVAGIISRWAPATDNNDHQAYTSTVANALGVKPDQPIDLHDSATLSSLTKSMIQVENGKQPYSDQQIALGLAAANSSAPQDGSTPQGGSAPVVSPATPNPNPAVTNAYRDPSIPTGNAIVDALPSDWKLHVLQLARSQAAQDMAAAREQLKGKVQDAQASYMVNGFAPNPPSEAEFIQSYGQADGIARYRNFQDVANLGQQLQQVKTLPATSLEQLYTAAKPVPGDGFAEREHNYEILGRAIDSVQQARQQDPILYALQNGNYGFKPIQNMNDLSNIGKELAKRAASAGQIAGNYGTAPVLLSKPETAALSGMLKAAPVDQQKSYLAGMYQSIGDMGLFKTTMQSIAPDNPTMAVAGMYQAKGLHSTEGRDVADLILRGQAILTPNTKTDGSGHEGGRSLIKMPEDKLMLSDWTGQTGDAFKGREQANDLFQQTAKAIYAARSAEDGDYSGDMNSKRWKSAIALATGGIENYNGAKIVMPYGMPFDTFQNTLKDRVDSLTKTSPPVAATSADMMRLPLENVGDGRYFFRRGAGYVVDTNGRPLVVDVNPVAHQ